MLKGFVVVAMAAALGVVAPAGAQAAGCSGAPHDINGDGYGDVVVLNGSALGQSTRLHVFYGTASGPATGPTGKALDDQIVPDAQVESLAVGDFNGDGCADVATGAGVVRVWLGGPAGLSDDRRLQLTEPVVHPDPSVDVRFGQALAVGDFDGDGVDDLAVGTPGAPSPILMPVTDPDYGGSVYVFGGQRSDVPLVHWIKRINQDAPGIPDVSEKGDEFGAALLAGDLDHNGVDDLVIGVPGEFHNAGMIVTVRSAKKKPLTGPAVALTENSGLIPGRSVGRPCPEAGCYLGDQFGAVMTIGDVNGDGRADVAVRSRRQHGSRDALRFRTNVLFGGTGKYAPFGTTSQTFDEPRVYAYPAYPHPVLLAQLGTDRYADLVLGYPDRTLGTAPEAGAVVVRRGGSKGLAKTTTTLTQATRGVAGTPEVLDTFGASLAAVPVQKRGRENLVVGIPGEWVSTAVRPQGKAHEYQGAITQFALGATLPAGTGSVTISEDTKGVLGLSTDKPGAFGRLVG
jgi:hypothetical protein